MTRPIFKYTVAPSLPKELERLRELADNLLWVWDHEILALFMRLDPDLWEASQHNPVLMLGRIKQERLHDAARDEAFLAQLDRMWERFTTYMDNPVTWYKKVHPPSDGPTIAYFSAEFGLTECLPIYSGGLGMLAGDHLKSASDLGVPLIGVGILYQQGYFRQYLNADGWQQERYPENNFYTMPLTLERDPDGKPITISVEYPGRSIVAQIWRVQVGRVSLYLLDTNIPPNSQEDQDITDQLYGGDKEMRVKQEIMLGIGGCRALHALGKRVAVCHMNEGHSAFLQLERCRRLMKEYHLSFAEAREVTTAGSVFTTHTPVPAGNDYFIPELMDKYFSDYYKELGLARKEFLGLGRQNPNDENESFCMTIMALRMSCYSNGVSKLHGTVSRKMWQNVWPAIPVDEVPVVSITNGVHAPSWISRDMAGLYDRYLGPTWRENPGEAELWGRVHQIPDEELWLTHERRRERLVAFARSRLRSQLESRGIPHSEVALADEILNPNALTIGFSRRFATYKRASLILRNPERLKSILTSKERPVQILFAGKAHPLDTPGKEIIRQIIHFERLPEVRRRMVFIEDYDMVVARYLVQGVDVWLNTPRRPLEASGTSGMKATLNGAINLSILDGWWDEAYEINTGWAIGRGEDYNDENYQDDVESNALYDLLEKEIIPLFYQRSADDLPRAWISRMKTAMRAICPRFNTNRMVREYTEKSYLPAYNRYIHFRSDEMQRAKELAAWKATLRDQWSSIKILNVKAQTIRRKAEQDERIETLDLEHVIGDPLKVGDPLQVTATLDLGKLTSADVTVELYQGVLDANESISEPQIISMKPTESKRGGVVEFTTTLSSEKSGRHGYTVRVLPRHSELDQPLRHGLILWA
ncbi:MAG: alpha-glucan family phosphorylase [Bacteroidota bacterium]